VHWYGRGTLAPSWRPVMLEDFEPDDLFTLLDLDFPVIQVLEVPIGIEVNFDGEFAGIIGGIVFSFPFYDLS
jgi:hypothetical protein